VLIMTSHWSLSSVRSIQITHSYPVSFISISIFSYLYWCPPIGIFPSDFWTKTL
jgi:hypothetical protein